MKIIDPHDLVPLNVFDVLLVDPVYSFQGAESADSPLVNQFPGLYHPEAKIMWAHRDLTAVVLVAARICEHSFGWRLRVADCLRTVEAQARMAGYGYHPSLVSKPGCGGHPRAMAVDIVPEHRIGGQWQFVDMGVPFDRFAPDPEDDNPAARDYTGFDVPLDKAEHIYLDRQRLEFAMRKAGEICGMEIWPLPHEWWDFRFLPSYYEQFAPLKEADLLPVQRLIDPDVAAVCDVLSGRYSDEMDLAISSVRRIVDASVFSG